MQERRIGTRKSALALIAIAVLVVVLVAVVAWALTQPGVLESVATIAAVVIVAVVIIAIIAYIVFACRRFRHFFFLPRVGSIQSPSTLFGQSMSCLSFDRPHVHSVPRSFIQRPVCHHLSAHTACAIPPLAQTCGQPNTPVER